MKELNDFRDGRLGTRTIFGDSSQTDSTHPPFCRKTPSNREAVKIQKWSWSGSGVLPSIAFSRSANEKYSAVPPWAQTGVMSWRTRAARAKPMERFRKTLSQERECSLAYSPALAVMKLRAHRSHANSSCLRSVGRFPSRSNMTCRNSLKRANARARHVRSKAALYSTHSTASRFKLGRGKSGRPQYSQSSFGFDERVYGSTAFLVVTRD